MKEPMKNPGIELARELTMIRLSVLDDALRMDQERRQNEMQSSTPTTTPKTNIFKFVSNEPKSDIRLFCSLVKTDNEHYSSYYKFEKDGYVTKEITRINIFCYDLIEYIEMDMIEFELNFEEKYHELYTICLNIKNND